MGDNQNRIMVPSRKPTSCSVCNNVGHTKPRCPINKNKPPPPADHAQVAQLFEGPNLSNSSSASVLKTNNAIDDDYSDYENDSGDDEYLPDDEAIREYQQENLDPFYL